MPAYRVVFETPNCTSFEAVTHSRDQETVLDLMELYNMDGPYSCRAGSCSSCAAFLISGTVSQEEGSFLDDDQISSGYILTCVSYPTSDLRVRTHVEDELYEYK